MEVRRALHSQETDFEVVTPARLGSEEETLAFVLPNPFFFKKKKQNKT